MNKIETKYRSQSGKLFQPVIISLFWILLFASPLLFGEYEDSIEWNQVFRVWKRHIPLLVLFFVNRFLLVPKLLFNNRRIIYILSVSFTMLTVIFVSNLFHDAPPRPNRERLEEFRPQNIPPHLQPGFTPKQGARPQRQHPAPQPKEPYPKYVNLLILSVLLIGFDTGLKLSVRWAQTEQKQANLKKESTENQLAFLRNQVSPHFFMNTLNNIHALIDIDTEEAKESVQKLSKLMRHLLYESNDELTPLKKELEFIESYIELMRIRFSEKVDVKFSVDNELSNAFIPPLLFTSLLENAFKYGVSYRKKSFIHISLSTTNNQLVFVISNSKNNKMADDSASGIGIVNTKKRLELLYTHNYTFEVKDTEEIYTINLTVPL